MPPPPHTYRRTPPEGPAGNLPPRPGLPPSAVQSWMAFGKGMLEDWLDDARRELTADEYWAVVDVLRRQLENEEHRIRP